MLRQDFLGYWVIIPMTQEEGEANAQYQREMGELHRASLPPNDYERCIAWTAGESMKIENDQRRSVAEGRNHLIDAALSVGENPDDYLVTEFLERVGQIMQERGGTDPHKSLREAQDEFKANFGQARCIFTTDYSCRVLVYNDEHAFHLKMAGKRIYRIEQITRSDFRMVD